MFVVVVADITERTTKGGTRFSAAGVGVSSIGVGDGVAGAGISPCADTDGEINTN